METLYGRLPICANAYQACAELEAIHSFLETDDNLQVSDHSLKTPYFLHLSHLATSLASSHLTHLITSPTSILPPPHHTLQVIDAPKVLRQVRGLRLPFERLVRNVWQAGPEVEYDKAKLALQRLLQKEVAVRKATKVVPPEPQPDVPPKIISPMVRGEMDKFKFKPERTMIGNVGLLTFRGKDAVVERKRCPTEKK